MDAWVRSEQELDPVCMLEREQSRSAVVHALGALSERDRRLVQMRHYERVTIARAARRLGMASSTAAAALNRVHAVLETALRGWV